ncbi:Sulfate adenylyltransferase subunit 2 [Nymphon striatum]|nr:Sulfate adenylyltransferase subunit 2 [Nymphon striatum]
MQHAKDADPSLCEKLDTEGQGKIDRVATIEVVAIDWNCPKMARTVEFDRNEVLENAMNTFWQNGYSMTSIPNLVKSTKLNPGSIYAAFKSKEGLFLETLEFYGKRSSEAIHIMREVAGQCENPVLLFSGGKDSICLLRLAEKAFRPSRFPFPLLHIDTGHNYPEVIKFRDQYAEELGERLIVRSIEDSIKRGTVVLKNADESRNKHQSVTLLEAIEEFGFDACIGGARRDEEKARAKERIMSFRDEFGQWDPEKSAP